MICMRWYGDNTKSFAISYQNFHIIAIVSIVPIPRPRRLSLKVSGLSIRLRVFWEYHFFVINELLQSDISFKLSLRSSALSS